MVDADTVAFVRQVLEKIQNYGWETTRLDLELAEQGLRKAEQEEEEFLDDLRARAEVDPENKHGAW